MNRLNLSHNLLVSLPEPFGSFVSLEILDVSSNALSSLPSSIGNLVKLRTSLFISSFHLLIDGIYNVQVEASYCYIQQINESSRISEASPKLDGIRPVS